MTTDPKKFSEKLSLSVSLSHTHTLSLPHPLPLPLSLSHQNLLKHRFPMSRLNIQMKAA